MTWLYFFFILFAVADTAAAAVSSGCCWFYGVNFIYRRWIWFLFYPFYGSKQTQKTVSHLTVYLVFFSLFCWRLYWISSKLLFSKEQHEQPTQIVSVCHNMRYDNKKHTIISNADIRNWVFHDRDHDLWPSSSSSNCLQLCRMRSWQEHRTLISHRCFHPSVNCRTVEE